MMNTPSDGSVSTLMSNVLTKRNSSMSSHWVTSLTFTACAVCSCFVNKYVLWVLKFTFPTIFQGWQCFVSLIVLHFLLKNRSIYSKIRSSLNGFHFIPELIFYTCSIYSGSKALSRLSVPVFVGLQNLSSLSLVVLKATVLEEKPKNNNIFSLLLLLVSCSFIWSNESNVKLESYFWMAIHVISVGFCSLFDSVNVEPISAEALIVLNYAFAFVCLAPCMFLFGDFYAVQDYQNFHVHKFYVGCVLSGLFSALTSLLYVHMVNSDSSSPLSSPVQSVVGYTALSRILAACLSKYVFEDTSAYTLLWCVVACLVVPSLQLEEKSANTLDEESDIGGHHQI